MALSNANDVEAAAEGTSSSSSSLLGEYLPLESAPLCSATRTFANLLLVVVGVGILGLPYTFSKAGWALGILSLLLGGILSYHGMMLQLYSKRRLHKSRGELDLVIAGYGDLAFHAFGDWGRFSVDVLLTLGTFSGAIAHMAFIGQNFASIATSVQSAHVQGMQDQSLHLSSQMAFSSAVVTCIGLHNITCIHDNIPSDMAEKPDVHTASRITHGNYSFLGYMHGNQNSLEFGSESKSLSEPLRHGVRNSAGSNMSMSIHSLAHWFLARINYLSPTTYIWCMFPLVVIVSSIPSIASLGPLSTLANTLNMGALLAIMVSDVLEIKKTSSSLHMKAFGDIITVPSAFGVGVFSFQASGIVIPLEGAMEKPSKFGAVMGMAFTVIGILYGLFAVLGYAAFGTETQQVITLNLRSGIEAVLIKSATSFSVFLAFPLVLMPLFELVERRFSRRRASLGLRALVVFVVCLLSTTVKQFTDYLSLSGSSLSSLLGFILPAAMHLEAMKEENGAKPASILAYVADYSLIVFGLVFGTFGTIHSFLKFL